MWNQVYEKIDQLADQMVEDRRYLHQHPELSFEEKETAAFIANRYDKLGIPYRKMSVDMALSEPFKVGNQVKTSL